MWELKQIVFKDLYAFYLLTSLWHEIHFSLSIDANFFMMISNVASKEKETSVVLFNHLAPLNEWRRKELETLWIVSSGFNSEYTSFFLIFPKPWSSVPVVCMACDNHINLCCLSLSPFFSLPFALPLFSLTLFGNPRSW